MDKGLCFALGRTVKLYIKNMVCTRCIMIVRLELEKLDVHFKEVVLGKVLIGEMLSATQIEQIKQALSVSGLELIENKKCILIERIKNVVIEMVYNDIQIKTNFSDYLSIKLDLDYTYLANIFSESEDTTIERYIIRHRIQRAKELITYNELNLTEISWKLNYSSVAHLSTQFKKITGITPSHFKSLNMISSLILNV